MGLQTGASLRTIDKGAQSNIDSAREAVARTPAEWAALWKIHNAGKPVPAVDFSRDMVVAVFAGTRPTAGYSVEITSITERDGASIVSYRESAPPRDAITAQVLTSPYHIVAVQKQSGDVQFEKKT